MQRGKAIKLWRDIVRGCRRIEDPVTRAETLGFAREEFRRNREVGEIVRCLSLWTWVQQQTSEGRKGWETGIDAKAVVCVGSDPILDIDREDAVGDHGEIH